MEYTRDATLAQEKQESDLDRTTEKLNLSHQVLSTDIPQAHSPSRIFNEDDC